jgi:nucleotide-binding universal stress UspA family protein
MEATAMLDIRRILFPTDFSNCAQNALSLAVTFAAVHEAELHMLHVLVLHTLEPEDPSLPFPGEDLAREQLARSGASTGRSRVLHTVKRGISTAPVLLDHAAEHEIDLIVMGTHGRRGFRRLLLGSVTEEVVRMAPCAVLAVRAEKGCEPTDEPSIARILVPIDFSPHAKLAIEYAHQIADIFDAQVDLLHVIELPTYPDFYVPVSTSALNVADLREQAARRLERLVVEGFGESPGRTVETHVVAGRTTPEIVGFAEETECDLIVIPSHGLSGLERVLLGSVAEGVVRRAPCSVLTAKPYGKRLGVQSDEESG